MSTRATSLILGLLLAAACVVEQPPPAPRLHGVSPAVIPPAKAAEVKLLGEEFARRLRLELDALGQSRPVGTFSVVLTGPARIALQAVTYVSDRELRAQVPPIAQVGTYSVELTDPWGRVVRLASAFNVAEECVTAAECADDGLSCTTAQCQNTLCVHRPGPDFCAIDGACIPAGTVLVAGGCQVCRPQVAADAWAPAVNGTACDDGNGCTLGESCQEGSCGEPTAVVECPKSACLQNVACEPSSGECPVIPVTGACDDGYACTTGDACVAGECRGEPVCGNTPPRACLTVSSAAETTPATFVVDARCTHDLESPDADLTVRFGVDGAWVTAAAPLGAPVSLPVSVPGNHVLRLEVKDPGGRTAYAERHVLVASAAETLVVTTRAAELDPGATPASPGGTGFSFQEAVAYANPPVDGGAGGLPAVIRFRAPMPVSAGAAVELRTAQLRVGGRPGVSVDFGNLAAEPCLTLGATDQQLIGLELRGCDGTLLRLAASGARLADVTVSGAAGAGIDVAANQAQLGPGLTVEKNGTFGIHLARSNGTLIEGARIQRNTSNGIEFDSQADALVVRSEIVFNGGAGFSLVKQNSSGRLWNNTVHGNVDNGVSARQSAGVNPRTVDVRNNLLTANEEFGVCGQSERFSALDPNGTSGNVLGAYCVLLDAGVREVDPRYLAPAAGDFRLAPGSAAIDGGVDLGQALPDLNGPAPGRWSGPSPDLGANEVID